MRPSHLILCSIALAFASAPVALGQTGSTKATPRPSLDLSAPTLSAVWNDPKFKQSFVAGYGINPDIEPKVPVDDIAILELVRQLMADHLPAAERFLKDSLRPESSAVIDLTLGGICFQQDRLDEALKHYRDAVEKFPSFRRAWRSIGLICTRKSDYDGAIAAFNRMIELGGADAYSFGLLGYCHSAKADYQPAESAYRNALLLQPDNVEWRLGLTRSVFKQEKFEDAASLLGVLLTQFPDKSDFWLLQAHTFLGLKRPLDAAANLEALYAIGKATVDSQQTLGDIYLSEGILDLARLAYERAIDLKPDQPPARSIRSIENLAARGGALEARGLLTKVQENWSETIADTDRRKLLKIAARLSMADGSPTEEAAATLEEIVALDPLDAEALMLLGQHYTRSGEPDKAILQYERAAAIESVAANAKVKIAQVYVSQGRFTEALPLLREAQGLRPRDDVARYIEQVERASKGRK